MSASIAQTAGQLYCTHEPQLAHQQIHTGSDNIYYLLCEAVAELTETIVLSCDI